MKILIENLPGDTSEEEMRQTFETYGNVTSVRLVKEDHAGGPRVVGWIDMPDKRQAEAALQALNVHELRGRVLTVREARPQTGAPGSPQRPPSRIYGRMA